MELLAFILKYAVAPLLIVSLGYWLGNIHGRRSSLKEKIDPVKDWVYSQRFSVMNYKRQPEFTTFQKLANSAEKKAYEVIASKIQRKWDPLVKRTEEGYNQQMAEDKTDAKIKFGDYVGDNNEYQQNLESILVTATENEMSELRELILKCIARIETEERLI